MLELRACTVDLATRKVHRDGETLSLTTREAELLAYLVERAGQPVSRDQLLVEAFGFSPSASSRAVDTAMRRLRDKVEHDKGQPDHLLSVFGVGYTFVATRPRTAPGAQQAPRSAGPLFGRAHALEQVQQLVTDQVRLITVTGIGGVGKTRLAAAIVEDLPDAAWCDLTASNTLEEVVTTVAQGLGLHGRYETPDALRSALSGVPPRWVCLDHAEPVWSAVAEVVRACAPHPIQWLVTSRRALGLDGEARVPLGPLEPGAAVEMLLHHARRAGAPEPTRDAARAVSEALEGIPLALQLAAARLTVLSPQDLLDRLTQPLAVLRSQSAGPQATMGAVIDASIALSTPAETSALAQLSVFAAPFRVVDAEAVVQLADAPSVLDVVAQLQARSLLAIEETSTADRRLRLYSVVRERARALLGEEDPVHARHRRAVVDRARRCARDVALGRVHARGMVELMPELWAAAQGADRAALAEILVATEPTVRARGPGARWREWLGQVWPERSALPGALQARLTLAYARSQVDARAAGAWVEEALQIATQHEDARCVGEAWAATAFHRRARDPEGAVEATAHALPRLDEASQAEVLAIGAIALLRLGRLDEARSAAERAVTLAEVHQARRGLATALANLARVREAQGAGAPEVEHLLRRARAEAAGIGLVASGISHGLAMVDRWLEWGRLDDAEALLDELRTEVRATGHRDQRAFVDAYSGIGLLQRADPRALVALERARRAFVDLGDDLTVAEVVRVAAWAHLVLGRPDEARACLASVPPSEVSRDLALEGWVFALRGQQSDAAAALQRAAAAAQTDEAHTLVALLTSRVEGAVEPGALRRAAQHPASWRVRLTAGLLRSLTADRS